MDEIDRLRFDEFEIQHAEICLEVHQALGAAPRLSPAARRFMAGEMDELEARCLGFVCDVGDGE